MASSEIVDDSEALSLARFEAVDTVAAERTGSFECEWTLIEVRCTTAALDVVDEAVVETGINFVRVKYILVSFVD